MKVIFTIKSRPALVIAGLSIFSNCFGMQLIPCLIARSMMLPKVSRNFLRIPTRSIVQATQLKHVDQVVSAPYKTLSPLNSAMLYEEGFLKNIHEFMPPTYPTVALIHSLFHRFHGNWHSTRNKSLPGASLTPKIAGRLVGHLQTGALADSQVQTDLIKLWKQTHKELFQGYLSTKKISDLMQTLLASQEECKGSSHSLFFPHLTPMIVGAALYDKVTSKKEIFEYLSELNHYVPLLGVSQDRLDKLVNDDYCNQALLWGDQLDKAKKQILHRQELPVYDTAEPLLCSWLASNMGTTDRYGEGAYPCPVISKYYGYQGSTHVPVCAEESLRNLCNIFVANPIKKIFDFSHLPPSVRPREELKKFYQNWSKYSSVKDYSAGQFWMNLISKIPGIKYEKKDYEITAGSENLLAAMNYLFNTQATSWHELCAIFSSDSLKINCKFRTKNLVDFHVIHTFAQGRTSEFNMRLVIEPDQHAKVDFVDFKKKEWMEEVAWQEALIAQIEKMSAQDSPSMAKLSRLLALYSFKDDENKIRGLSDDLPLYLYVWNWISGSYLGHRINHFFMLQLVEQLYRRKNFCDLIPFFKHLDSYFNRSLLTKAIIDGDKQFALQLIDAGINVNKTDCFDSTPIYHAILMRDEELIARLIKAGADVNKACGECTPLSAAIDLNNDRIVAQLIQAGADLDKKDHNKCSPLFQAIHWKYEKIIEQLIKAGADTEATYMGRSPLYHAVCDNNEKLVAQLVKAGADINFKNENTDYTVFQLACYGNNIDIIYSLINGRDDITRNY